MGEPVPSEEDDVATPDDDVTSVPDDETPPSDDETPPDDGVAGAPSDGPPDDGPLDDDTSDDGSPTPSDTSGPTTPAPSESAAVMPPSSIATPPYPWALPALTNCDDASLTTTPPNYCYASQTCGDEIVSAACSRNQADYPFLCDCGGHIRSKSYEVLGAEPAEACESVLEACKRAEEDVVPETDCVADPYLSMSASYCSTDFVCNRVLEDGDGITLIEKNAGSSMCFFPEAGAAPEEATACTCNYNSRTVQFDIDEVAVETACTSAFEQCASTTPPPLPDRLQCVGGDPTESDFACDYALLCTAPVDLGEGRELSYSKMPSVRCTRLRTESDWSCDCSWGEALALQVSADTPSDVACVQAINVCVTDAEIEITGPVSCDNLDQCAPDLFCVQPAMVNGIRFGIERPVSLTCQEFGPAGYSCTCQTSITSVEVLVDAPDVRAACPLGIAACDQAFAAEGGTSTD